MNILFDATNMNGDFVGIAKTTFYLYAHCHKLDKSFHAWGFNSDREEEYIHEGISLIGRKSRGELYDFAEKNNISIVHYPANFITRPLLFRLKSVLTIHDLIPYEEKHYFRNWWGRPWYLLSTQFGCLYADLVTTVSEYSCCSITRFTRGKVTPLVNYWGVTLPQISEPQKPLYDNYFLYVGGYDERKGIERLVDSFVEMKRRGLTECKLILVGTAWSLSPGVDKMIRTGVEEGYIVQTGYVEDKVLCNLYANAVCAVYLSRNEGFGLTLIESMRFGCPVITTDRSSLPEIGGDAACYVDRENKEEIIKMMYKMEHDSELRKKCVELGKENIKRFDWDITARRFLDALQSLAENRGVG